MKKLFSSFILIVLAVFTVMLPLMVFADSENPVFSFSDDSQGISVEPGSVFTIAIDVDDATAMKVMQGVIEYNKSVFEITDVKPGNVVDNTNLPACGVLVESNEDSAIEGSLISINAGDGPLSYTARKDSLLIISLKVSEEAEPGQYNISLYGQQDKKITGLNNNKVVEVYGRWKHLGPSGKTEWLYFNQISTTINVIAPNTAPALSEGVSASADAAVETGTAYTVDLSQIFADADGDTLSYSVKNGDGEYTDIEGSTYSFTPDASGMTVLTFKANDGTADSTDTYTVNLKASSVMINAGSNMTVSGKTVTPARGYSLQAPAIDPSDSGISAVRGSNGTYTIEGTPTADTTVTFSDAVRDNSGPILAYGVNPNDTASVRHGKTYTVDLSRIFIDPEGDAMTYYVKTGDGSFTETDGKIYSFTPSGAGKTTLTFKANDGQYDSSKNYTVTVEALTDTAPKLASGVNAQDSVSVNNGRTWSVDLSRIFTDEDGEDLTYYVKTDDGQYEAVSGHAYSFTPQTSGTTTLVFKANDGTLDSDGTYTVSITASSVADKFSDVPGTGHWAHDAVVYVLENNIIYGVSPTQFAPEQEVSRAMVVTVLYRMAGSPSVSGTSGFADVSSDTWYSDAVSWAAANGIVSGYGDSNFGPEDLVTREQFAAIMHRFALQSGRSVSESADISSYSDMTHVSDWALDSMKWAVGSGIISGTSETDKTLEPLGTLTRAELASVLYRFSR